jgi:hypothetical protein
MDSFCGLGAFGDTRLDMSGYFLHEAMVASPSCCVRALGKARAREIQYTRFLNNKRVTPEQMAAHAADDTARLAQGRHILAIQDSSDICLGGKRARAAGFGPVGKGGNLGGLCLHSMLAVDLDDGGAIGLVDFQIKNRTGGKVTPHRARELRQRESYRWVDTVKKASLVLEGAASITVASDRESDIYEGYASRPSNVHLLTRSARDRRIVTEAGQPQSLYAFSDTLPVCQQVRADIPPAPKRQRRQATLDLRYATLTLRRPRSVKASTGAPRSLSLTLVDIREVAPPPKTEPIHWRLLTTRAVNSPQEARQIVALYQKRWLIEEYFKILKSGAMDVESAKIGKPATMMNMLGAASVAAVTIMKLKQARDGTTQEGLEVVFDATDEPLLEELTFELEGNTQKQKNPHPPGSLARAQWVIARLGGWDGYYGKPGPKTYRRGLDKFYAIKLGAKLAARLL